jgi:hypothetical protein
VTEKKNGENNFGGAQRAPIIPRVDSGNPGGVEENRLKRCLKGGWVDSGTPGGVWICLSTLGQCFQSKFLFINKVEENPCSRVHEQVMNMFKFFSEFFFFVNMFMNKKKCS